MYDKLRAWPTKYSIRHCPESDFIYCLLGGKIAEYTQGQIQLTHNTTPCPLLLGRVLLKNWPLNFGLQNVIYMAVYVVGHG